MMERRAFIATLAFGTLAAEAQQGSKVHRVGVLVVSAATEYWPNVNALRQGLRDLGYIEGKNLVLEYRWAEGRYDRLANLATELVGANVQVIVTHGTPGTRAVKGISKKIPIVMATVGDAVDTGLVASLAKPGGNVTGMSFFVPELVTKRIDLLNECLPNLKRVAVLVNGANPAQGSQLFRFVDDVARLRGLEVHRLPINAAEDLEAAFAAMVKRGMDGLVVVEDALINSLPKDIAQRATRNRVPTIGFKPLAAAGGLLAYAVDHRDLWARAASYVDKILKGANPSELPVEQPTKFDLVVNLKTAKALGLTIPPSILVRADQVIE